MQACAATLIRCLRDVSLLGSGTAARVLPIVIIDTHRISTNELWVIFTACQMDIYKTAIGATASLLSGLEMILRMNTETAHVPLL